MTPKSLENIETSSPVGTKETKKIASTHDAIAFGIIAEYIFKSIYISGSGYNSIVPRKSNDIFRRMLRTSTDSLSVLTGVGKAVKAVYDDLTKDERHTLILNQAKYIFSSCDRRNKLILGVIDIAYKLDILDEKRLIFKLFEMYLLEKTNALEYSINNLKESLINCGKISAKRAFKKIFELSSASVKSTWTKVVFKQFYCKKKNAIKKSRVLPLKLDLL